MTEHIVKKVIKKEVQGTQIDPKDPSKGYYTTIVTEGTPQLPGQTMHFPDTADGIEGLKEGDTIEVVVDEDFFPYIA